LTLELEYFRNKLRLHNRLLHGWGVVCGAQVCPLPKANGHQTLEPWKVVVKPGYILGPYGDEIVIQTERITDLRTGGVTSRPGDPPGELVDPWCSAVYVAQLPEWVYVAVRYKEITMRPVRVQPVGCGCDETLCEYSRLCDGYEIGILTACPASHQNPPKLDNLADLAKGPLFACPPCPSDPWVVLAAVKLAQDGTITEIDNCSCRRMVLSFANVWWRCEGAKIEVHEVTVQGDDEQGGNVSITVSGANFRSVGTVTPEVTLGSGVTVGNIIVPDGTSLTFTAAIDRAATPGPRTMTIINPDCSMVSHPDAIIIKAKGPERMPSPPDRPSGGEAPPPPAPPPSGEEQPPPRRTRRRGGN
jgi:hypothetical protein